MYRLALLCGIAIVFLVPSAQAIEMFTNFHNGENVGFPPLEVPAKFYGHGGWQPASRCRPERVESIESVPAMTPTGRAAVTPTGFIRRDHGRRGYDTQHMSNQGSDNQQNDNQPTSNQQAGNQSTAEQAQFVSDRRRSFGGGNDSSAVGYNQQSAEYESSESPSSQAPTPAKVAPKSDGWTRSLEQAPAEEEHGKRPTSVFARPGSAPQSDSSGKTKTNTGQGIDQRQSTTPGASSRRSKDLPSVVPARPLD